MPGGLVNIVHEDRLGDQNGREWARKRTQWADRKTAKSFCGDPLVASAQPSVIGHPSADATGSRHDRAMTFAKVCGLTDESHIDWAIELGYDAIGIVVAPKSVRYCPPERARSLAAHARGRIPSFVVALSWAQAEEVADSFEVVQIYEPVPLPNLAFASKYPPPAEVSFEWFVYDASTGSGVFEEFPDWVAAVPGKLLVAGGLDVGNVGQVIDSIKPFGVDVSSGVESAAGVKDRGLMSEYIAEVRRTRSV